MKCFQMKKKQVFQIRGSPDNLYAIQHQSKEQLLLETLHSNCVCIANIILTAL